MIRKMGDVTPEDYLEIGLKSGLEIHQQLDTERKLFCRCPVLPYSDEYDGTILRHMRPTLSELGEYDGTALMEFKTRKNIIYRINRKTICTYEIDDTPPFELNRQALEIALEITMLLNCKLVSEIHIQRKQYLDGSIPAGFQRTTILGVDGWIPFRGRKIDIVQLGLEEDACREVSDRGHERVYLTDRLGMPLIETVTAPQMRTPQEVAAVANTLRNLARASGKVRTGIGAARQDVNVSVKGGRRVEIKGVSRIHDIPMLVHNEAFRQVSLLEIRDELLARGMGPEDFEYTVKDITELLRNASFEPLASAPGKDFQVRAVLLRGYAGILSVPLQPGRTFADEISDRVRVIACLDVLPNILYDDMTGGEGLSAGKWSEVRKAVAAGDGDAVVLVWGPMEDLETAVEEIAIRAGEAMDGVPHETRQAFPDGTTGFERILPGPDRMYPDTDLPPLAISDALIKKIRSGLPERPWEREKRYLESGVPEESAHNLSISPGRFAFDSAMKDTDYPPRRLAHFFLSVLGHLKAKYPEASPGYDTVLKVLKSCSENGLPLEAAEAVLVGAAIGDVRNPEEFISGFRLPGKTDVEETAEKIMKEVDLDGMMPDRAVRYVTGLVRKRLGGIPGGIQVMETVAAIIESPGRGEEEN